MVRGSVIGRETSSKNWKSKKQQEKLCFKWCWPSFECLSFTGNLHWLPVLLVWSVLFVHYKTWLRYSLFNRYIIYRQPSGDGELGRSFWDIGEVIEISQSPRNGSHKWGAIFQRGSGVARDPKWTTKRPRGAVGRVLWVFLVFWQSF